MVPRSHLRKFSAASGDKIDLVMKKQSKKQIKAELINEVSASYRGRIKALEEKVKYLLKELHRNKTELYEFKHRALTAEDKLEQYADWNRRLQEFMDMNPDEREKAIQAYKTQEAFNIKIEPYINLMSKLFM